MRAEQRTKQWQHGVSSGQRLQNVYFSLEYGAGKESSVRLPAANFLLATFHRCVHAGNYEWRPDLSLWLEHICKVAAINRVVAANRNDDRIGAEILRYHDSKQVSTEESKLRGGE